MRSPLKALLISGALVAASLGGAASAAAKPSPPPPPPSLITTNFACSNGVCEAGPGNVGMPFGAGLDGTGGPACTGADCACTPYIMSVASGSLPPGLQLGRNPCGEWFISGTPIQAGTYPFTVQITPQLNNLGQPNGPPGTQQLTITIGTGHSDRALITGATWNGHYSELTIQGYDANIGALWSVSVTSTGRVLFSNRPNSQATPDGLVVLRSSGGYPCPVGGCDLTVTNNLGSTATVFLGKPIY